MSLLSSLFVGSLLLYVVLEASIRDTVTVSEESKKLSIPQIKKTLNKAHLENHGYRKKVAQETSKDSRGRLIYSKTTSFTYKHGVPCSKAPEVVKKTERWLLKNTEDPTTGNKVSNLFKKLGKEMGTQKTVGRLCEIKVDLKTTRLSPPTSGKYRPKKSAWWGSSGGSSSGGSSSGGSNSGGSNSGGSNSRGSKSRGSKSGGIKSGGSKSRGSKSGGSSGSLEITVKFKVEGSLSWKG